MSHVGASVRVDGCDLSGPAPHSAAPYSLLPLLLVCSGVSGIGPESFGCLSLRIPCVPFSLQQFARLAACSPHLFPISLGSSPVLTEVQYHENSCPCVSNFWVVYDGRLSPVTPSHLRMNHHLWL